MSYGSPTGPASAGRTPSATIRRSLLRTLPLGGALLALLMTPVALASALNDVVREPGTIAGQPYSYWMTQAWDLYFTSPAPGPSACQTVTLKGTAVTVVGNFKGGNSSCNVPSGSAIYVNEYSNHCSTLEGEHNGFGTSAADITQCALGPNHATAMVGISSWLDGQQVPTFGHYFWIATNSFQVSPEPERFPEAGAGPVTAAAWGWSLLLRPLPKGTHTVRCRVTSPAKKTIAESTVTLHVG